MSSETFLLLGNIPLEMLPVPGVGLVGKFPITQAQWRAVMGENPSHFQGDNLPVEQVSRNDCQKLCEKLSAYTGRKFRLPTAAEWDIALAGQDASLDAGWFWENSGKTTHPVGLKEPNKFGLYDMQGNVWEWCEDGEDEDHFLRGGSGSFIHRGARSVVRLIDHPAVRYFNLGCRVVCVVRPPERTHFRSLAAIVEQLEACDYRCEAGALANNTAFIELRAGARDEGCLASAPPCGDCAWCRMFGENE